MTTKLKITGKLSSGAEAGIEPYAQALYDTPGKRIIAIVELARHIKHEPDTDPDVDTEPAVNVRITSIEVARAEQERYLREAAAVIYAQRSARGTLDEEGQMKLDESTVEHLAGLVAGEEVARLQAGLKVLGDEISDRLAEHRLGLDELYDYVRKTAERLRGLANPPVAVAAGAAEE